MPAIAARAGGIMESRLQQMVLVCSFRALYQAFPTEASTPVVRMDSRGSDVEARCYVEQK